MMSIWIQRIFYFIVFLLLAACTGPVQEHPREAPPPPVKNMADLQIITQDGGHLAWSKKYKKVAFDRLGKDGYFDLWLMNPDGTGQKSLTSDHPLLPNKHIGQPAWHPSGRLLVIQAQKAHVPRYADTKCTPGAGALNDLWVITSDGKQAWKIHTVRDEVSKNAAGVLHPHFSNDGTRLFWSERIRHNEKPFGEWILRIADFYFNPNSGPRLGAIRDYNPGGKSAFFESHNFSPDDRHVLFTGNQDGPLEIYELNIETGNARRLTHHSPMTWDEHAHYAPDGRSIVWMSSLHLRFKIKPFDLQTDFWIMNRDGTQQKRLTWFHAPRYPHYLARSFAVAADLEWSPSGDQIMGLVITGRPDTRRRGSGLIVLLDLPIIYR